MQQEYVQARKDQARPVLSEPMHRELSEHITRVTEQNKGLQRELIGYKDQCLVLQTKLSDAHLMLGSQKNQLDREQQHREELQKLIQMHRWQETTSTTDKTNKEEASQESKRVKELQELLVHQKEESDGLLKRQEVVIEQLHSALTEMNEVINSQEKRFDEEIRRISAEATQEVENLRAQLGDAQREKNELSGQLVDFTARLEAVNQEIEKYQTTSQMQTEEINRLNMQISNMETDNGQPITRDTVKGLVDKIDQLRFQYLEKERELEVYRKRMEDTETSHKKVLQVKEQETAHLNSCLELIKKEADTLRDLVDSQRRSSQAPSEAEDMSQSADILILKELITKLETEAANLRGQVLELNDQLKETKRVLNQTSFELIKKEEEVKVLDQKNLKIQFDLRHFEGMDEENRELNQRVSALRNEYEALQASTSYELDFMREKLEAAPKVPAVQAADPAVVADMRAQTEALFAEINLVKT